MRSTRTRWQAVGVGIAMLLVMPSLTWATALSVSGAPRALNTLEQSWPTWACMNPVANGGAGSYRWDFSSNPGNYFTIDSTYGTVTPVTPLAAGSYPITVRVTDLNNATATLGVTVPVVTTGLIVMGNDTLFDNYAGSSWFSSLGVLATGFVNNSYTSTWTLTDPSGYFGIDNSYNYLYYKNSVPPVGSYPISISVSQAGVGSIGPFNFTIQILHAQQITSITYTQNTVSTSEVAGCIVGTASTTVWEPGYQWSIPTSGSDGGTFTILDPTTGVVTLAKTPALGNRSITIQVKDGTNTYSQGFTVNVVAGTVVPPGNMSMTVASNLDNFTSSGSVGTPSISGGIPGTKAWSFAGGGVGNRYAIDPTTGQVTIIGCLSYQPTMDGVDYSDVLAITCTDGINTCTNSYRIPVAACVGPTYNVGPGQTYVHLNDVMDMCYNAGWGRQFAGMTINIYPSTDPNYYLNDGQKDWGFTLHVPGTIQGAPGQTFPVLCGGGVYYGDGFVVPRQYDLWVKNLEICNVTDGSNVSANDNLAGISKDAGQKTGNVFVDNCYVHDCQMGLDRGCAFYTNWFVTNTRISHCGVGQPGQTHNIYVTGSTAYFKNLLSDQSPIGHTFKSRAVKTVITNSRLFDGEHGHGSCSIDLPEGGVNTITNTVIQKGPNYQNPNALHFASTDAAENLPSNALTVSGSSWYLDTDGAQLSLNGAVDDQSRPGSMDGIYATVNMTNCSFWAFLPANYVVVEPWNGNYGASSVTGSIALTAQPALDWSFPGSGPDPTVAHPPGPFLAPYGVYGGAQIRVPVNEIRISSGSPIGTSVVNLTWLPGNTGATSPTWSLRGNPGNRYAINASTGAITTAAALVPGTVDVLQVQVYKAGVNFGQWFSGGSEDYYNPPPTGYFWHRIWVVVSGSVPLPMTTLQNGLNGYTGCNDSYMNAAAATTNYGTNTKMSVCGYADQGLTNRMRPILRFDLSSISPATTVNNATLYVYSYDSSGIRGSYGYYGLYPLTRGFTESQVTWTIAATGTNWTTAGGDFNATADAQATKQGVAGVWYAFGVAGEVQNWVNNPSNNYGWVLKCTDENLHNQDYFTASDNSDTTHRPKLVINDTSPPDTTAPAAVGNLATSSPTSSSITVSWTAPGDDGNSGTATTYDIRYSTSTITEGNFFSATQVTGVPAPAVAGTNQNVTVTGLSPSTTYYFAMKTADEVPNWSSLSNVATGTTSAGSDTTPPAAVSNLSCSNITASSVQLNWTAPGDDGNTGTATTYDIRYSTSVINAGNWASATQVSGEPTPLVAGTNQNMVVSGLTADTTYYFAIETADEVPNWSSLSNVPSAHTVDSVAPAAVANLSVSNITAGSVQLNWTAPGDNGSTGTATTYDIRYSTSVINAGNWASATQVSGEPTPLVAGTNQNMVVSGLSGDTTYYFAIETADEVPNWSSLSNVPSAKTSDTVAPAAVSNLATSSPTTSSITLTWTAPGDNGSTGTATTYDIRYSTSTINSGNWASATQVTGEPAPLVAGSNQNMVITGLNPNTTYYFAIETADEVPNWSSLSNVPSGTTAAAQIRTVGSGYTYSTVQAAHDAAADWDTIQIYGGPFVGSAGWANISKNHLTIVGMGSTRVVLDANGSCLSSKGIFNISGTNTTVQNLEFKNCRVASTYNSADIRQQAANLTVSNCYFHDSDIGISADNVTGSTISVSTSEFYNNGYAGSNSGNLKIGVVDSFTLQYCYVHMAVGGDEVRSSALVSYLLYNRITDETATDSYDINFAAGGTSIVLGNLIQKSANGNGTMIQYGTGNPATDLHVVNNTLVSNLATTTGVNNAAATNAQIQNNIFQGVSTLASGANTQTTNWSTSNAYLQDAANYDYHLTPSSSGAINAATSAGSVSGFSLTPVYQYVQPSSSEARPSNGTLDIGAYEFVRTFQYGLNSYTGVTDSYLSDPNPTTNYGTSTKLSVTGYSDQGAAMYRPVVKFDLSSIPTTTTITGATLYVYAYDAAALRGSTGYYGVYPLTRSFTESQCTWNIAATGTNWTTPGGDFGTVDAQAAKQGVAGVWYAFNVTSRVQSMISTPSGNYGWVLKCTDESLHNQDNFTSSNNSDTVHRPKLCIYGY